MQQIFHLLNVRQCVTGLFTKNVYWSHTYFSHWKHFLSKTTIFLEILGFARNTNLGCSRQVCFGVKSSFIKIPNSQSCIFAHRRCFSLKNSHSVAKRLTKIYLRLKVLSQLFNFLRILSASTRLSVPIFWLIIELPVMCLLHCFNAICLLYRGHHFQNV